MTFSPRTYRWCAIASWSLAVVNVALQAVWPTWSATFFFTTGVLVIMGATNWRYWQKSRIP